MTDPDDKQEYLKVLAEVKERLVKFAEANRVRGVQAVNARLFKDGAKLSDGTPLTLPTGEPLKFEDISNSTLLRHFVFATVLVVAEHEMRLRDLEKFLDDVSETVRSVLEKAEEMARAAKASGAPN